MQDDLTSGQPRRRALLDNDLFVEIPEPQHPTAAALADFWRARQEAAGGLPSRDAFSPEALSRIGALGHQFVIEPIDGGRDWRYRLLGSKIVWLFGRDTTNVAFSEHFQADEARQCIALSNQVVATRTPVFLRARFSSGGHWGTLETMSLPVWNRTGDDIWLFGASFPEDPNTE